MRKAAKGFTLIELAIVLVIIGLIVGGVLVGRDLTNAAAVRAQISQIEKYKTSMQTFYGKFSYLPGDIKDPEASSFGFTPRGTAAGSGDGNGLLQANYAGSVHNSGMSGEVVMFWRDLSQAGLIEGSFTAAQYDGSGGICVADHKKCIPTAKINSDNFLHIVSVGYCCPSVTSNNENYMVLSAISSLIAPMGHPIGSANITVRQAFDIDKKIDDGLPQQGNVIAAFTYGHAATAWVGHVYVGDTQPVTTATPATSSTCYDNNNVDGDTQQYSLTQNDGRGPNCALSFKLNK